MKIIFENKKLAMDNGQSAKGKGQWTKVKKRKMLFNALILPVAYCLLLFVLSSCNNNSNNAATEMYTCPMPEDSVFSDKPGKCPKCGMDLVLMENHALHTDDDTTNNSNNAAIGYTCPMHPNIHSDSPGVCTICGMQLEKIKSLNSNAVSLTTLLRPSNQQVIANVPMIHMQDRMEDIEMETYGFVTYDTRLVGAISSNFSGRIEKLYVKYRYQKVNKGQRIMDIYSPELLTAQENLLFLLKNDPGNEMLINASKQKLYLLGMSKQQLSTVIKTRKSSFRVSIFSNYSGHVHEANSAAMGSSSSEAMLQAPVTTNELSIKEGMYIQKGQNVFSVYNPNKAWVLLNIFTGQAAMVKVGNRVRITPETNPDNDFRATISYIEPVFREGSKTVTARVYFDNTAYKIPIGSQVKATVFAGERSANWLPEEAILSLGLDKVVFVRMGEAFVARKIETGIINKHLVQVLNGLEKSEAVAANAQYLVDSESFIKAE